VFELLKVQKIIIFSKNLGVRIIRVSELIEEIRYIILQQEDRVKVRNVKVIPNEKCVPKHKLLVHACMHMCVHACVHACVAGHPRMSATQKLPTVVINYDKQKRCVLSL